MWLCYKEVNWHAKLTLAHTPMGQVEGHGLSGGRKMTMAIKLIFGTPFEPNLPRSHNCDVLGADKRIKYFHHHPDLRSPMLFSR